MKSYAKAWTNSKNSYTTPVSTLADAWVVVPDGDIVPEADQNKLMWWRDIFRAGEFDIGDIANRLCQQASERGFKITQQRVFDAVGSFCGRSGRTVRYYAETARFYSPDTRSEYNVLPFSHFVLARYVMGDDWKEMLDYAMLHPKISEEALRAYFVVFAKLGDDVSANSFDLRVSEDVSANNLPDGILRVSDGSRVSEGSVVKAGNALSLLSSVLEQLDTILRRFKFSTELNTRITTTMVEFRSLIQEIATELRER